MSLFPLFHWLQSSEFFAALSGSQLVYPIVMTTHLACIAVFGGMILMTDLRLLGLAFTSYPAAEFVGSLRIWKRIGFCIMVAAGSLLFGAKAETYYGNPYFWAKLTLLALVGVHAMIFRSRVYGNLAEPDRAGVTSAEAKVAAYISLALWIGILCMGRLIAYYEPPRGPFATAPLYFPAARLRVFNETDTVLPLGDRRAASGQHARRAGPD